MYGQVAGGSRGIGGVFFSSVPPEMAWGFFGALSFAGQYLSTCLYAHRGEPGHWRWCTLDAVIALGVGTLAAAAFTTWLAEIVAGGDQTKVPGIAVLIGLLANGVKPVLLEQAPKSILRWIQSKGPIA